MGLLQRRSAYTIKRFDKLVAKLQCKREQQLQANFAVMQSAYETLKECKNSI